MLQVQYIGNISGLQNTKKKKLLQETYLKYILLFVHIFVIQIKKKKNIKSINYI